MLSDDFYRALEDRFRGSRETIKARQSVYLPVVEALHAKVPKQVLDVGCGAGRHSLAAQDLGLTVVAIDISPGAVEVSR